MAKIQGNTVVLGIALLTGFFSTARSAEFFTDQGSMWYGGSLCYLSEYYRSSPDPVILLLISPTIRFFPARYFVLSPAFSWENMSQAHEKSSHGSGAFTLGPEFGFAYGNTIHSVPYVISGIKYAHAYSKTTSSTINGLSQTTSNSADGYRIPLYTGIMVPIFEGLGVQLETGFTYSHLRYSSDEYSMGTTYDQDMSTFSISIGVCGIGKSTAISFLNTLIDFL